jgi:hypothetical protein
MALISVARARQLLEADNDWRRYQVSYPPSRHGRFEIQLYQIERLSEGRLRNLQNEGINRDTGSGTFRRLVEHGVPGAKCADQPDTLLWMSDTRAEIAEHAPVINKMFWASHAEGRRVLVNGLGLGLVVLAAASLKGIAHVDVVERDPDVVALVGQYLPEDKVTVHLGDAYAIQWPRGTRWDIAWHDIWPTISDDNLPGMDELRRKYRHRVAWQGCWQRRGCLIMRKVYRQMEDGTLPPARAFEILMGRWHF